MVAGRKEKTDPLILLGKQLLGRYAIQDRIAQGGMSVIYRGHDERLQRPVCVKVFFGLDGSSVAHLTGYEHFVQEAFALSQLKHPNTIRIYDFGYLDMEPHSPFHVSELMEGGTLRTYLEKHGPLPIDRALEILEPVVGALAEAHSRSIVHRDIKPANILYGNAGARLIFKLADFGIAKAYVDELNRAIPNRAQDTRAIDGRRISLYSPGWAAPEQLRGKPVGPFSDVFALGLVTVFMLTGKKVFSDDEFRRVLERAEGDAYVERALATADLPPRITNVVRKSCRVHPAERQQNVEEFLVELRAATAPIEPLQIVASRPLQSAAGELPVKESTNVEQPKAEPESAVVPTPADAVRARLADSEITMNGRRIRFLSTAYQLDIDSGDDPAMTGTRVRFRVTLLPDHNGRLHLHLKGLNCFIAKPGSRVTNAVNMDSDTALEVFLPDRQRIEEVRCIFGSPTVDGRLFPLGSALLAVPHDEAARAVMLDFGPSRDSILVYRTWQVAKGVVS